MGRVRDLIKGSAVGAALGVVAAPRLGESRGAALERLRLTLRPGRGALGAFAGTPCAAAGPDRPRGEAAAAASVAQEGADDGGH